MLKLMPTKKILCITLAGVVFFYAINASFLRATAAGVMDHMKILCFAVIVVGWMLLCLAVGSRLKRRGVGVRVAIIFSAVIAIAVVMEVLKWWLHDDPVWRELWDTTSVVFFFPVVQSLLVGAHSQVSADAHRQP